MSILNQILRATTVFIVALFLSAASLERPASVQGQTRSQAKPPVKTINRKDGLAAFLLAPIDLVAFKRKKFESNSDSINASRWFYRPKKTGFFYQYMLFPTPEQYNEVERFEGFSIVVYKFDRKIGDYNDTNEMLVAIWCRLRDFDLGQANLVGTQASEIKARFGEPFAVIGENLIYQREGRALSVHTNGGAVDWFKYVRLSRHIEAPGEVPEMLLHPGPGW